MPATLILVAFMATGELPKRIEPPPPKELAAIAERGRNLAGYDTAVWHASDAVQAIQPKEGRIAQYIAHKTENGWVVAFGKLNDAQDAFLIAYEATQGKAPDKFNMKEFDPPRSDAGAIRSSARAIDTVLKDFAAHFRGQQRPYNVAVLPAEEGEFWVYFVPAPTKVGVWPLGGDVRYRTSADGSKILDKRQLHKSVIEVEQPKADPSKPLSGFHTHILDDVPEDTDVFHVLSRKPAFPEVIATPQFAYQVDVDGSIKYLGKAKDLFKAK